jgi:signal transduction histidine kinase
MELLAADPAGTDAAEVDGALDELNRLARMVDGLLAVARAENITESPEPVAVGRLLADRAEAWRPVAAERNAHLSLVTNQQVMAMAVPGHLEQVLDNLIDNALTAIPEGGRVGLSARRAGHRVHVTVTDDGPGMSREAMEQALRRFHTAGGTGLGLAIVHRLVTAGGGNVTLSDARGGGLEVTLDLPSTSRR